MAGKFVLGNVGGGELGVNEEGGRADFLVGVRAGGELVMGKGGNGGGGCITMRRRAGVILEPCDKGETTIELAAAVCISSCSAAMINTITTWVDGVAHGPCSHGSLIGISVPGGN